MNRDDVSAKLLANHYKMNGTKPVAFLDESYREANEHEGESPFYLFTAVVILPSDMAAMRKELQSIAGGEYWHTTEALQVDGGRDKALEMLGYLAEGSDPCVIAKHVSIDPNDVTLEDARAACFTSLAMALTSEGNAWGEQSNLLVLERRKNSTDRNRDEKTFKDARTAELLPRNATMFQASPSFEKLLWLADVVSSAVRRDLAVGESEFYDKIKDQVHFLDPFEG